MPVRDRVSADVTVFTVYTVSFTYIDLADTVKATSYVTS